MKTQTLEYSSDGLTAHIVITEATARQGMKRSRLIFEAGAIDDPDLRILRGFYYPALVASASVIEINGTVGDPAFEDFAQLPEQIVTQWEAITFALNPHWLPPDDDEKKAPN